MKPNDQKPDTQPANETKFERVVVPQLSQDWLFEYNEDQHIINWNDTPEVAALRPEVRSHMALSYFTNRYYNNTL